MLDYLAGLLSPGVRLHPAHGIIAVICALLLATLVMTLAACPRLPDDPPPLPDREAGGRGGSAAADVLAASKSVGGNYPGSSSDTGAARSGSPSYAGGPLSASAGKPAPAYAGGQPPRTGGSPAPATGTGIGGFLAGMKDRIVSATGRGSGACENDPAILGDWFSASKNTLKLTFTECEETVSQLNGCAGTYSYTARNGVLVGKLETVKPFYCGTIGSQDMAHYEIKDSNSTLTVRTAAGSIGVYQRGKQGAAGSGVTETPIASEKPWYVDLVIGPVEELLKWLHNFL